MIGLLDYDCLQSESTTRIIPNLEIMKLATYYKTEENHFCRLLSLDEKELDSYEKIYFFSETGRKLLIPDSFKRANNVIYGGTAFTNGEYIPFENEIIDYIIPKIAIYKNFLKEKYSSGIKNLVITHVLDDTYYRMYAGNNKLPVLPIQTKKRVFIYDRTFFYPDWQEIIQEISDRKPSGIYTIHPIICKTLSQFFSIRKKEKIAKTNEIILDLDIPLNEVNYMLKNYKKLFLAEIFNHSRIYIPLKSNWVTVNTYYKNIIYTLNLLYAFWANSIPIKIYLYHPKIGIINPVMNFEQFIVSWSSSKNNKTLFEKFKKNNKMLAEYEKIIKNFPYAKTLFNQTYKELSAKGFWNL